MRIAYLTLHRPRPTHTGVGKKITRQIGCWQANGHDVRLFMHMYAQSPKDDLLPAEYFEYQRGKGVTRMLTREYTRVQALRKTLAAVAANRPDMIYFRMAIYIYGLENMHKIAPVVVENITNDIDQHRFVGRFYFYYNLLTRGLILRKMAGLVVNSGELAEARLHSRYHRPTRVITDGIDLAQFPALPAPCNPVPRLVFVGSPGNAWHGVDKLIAFAGQNPDLTIDVVGYTAGEISGELPTNLHALGYLAGEDYLAALGRADVAISSLALHRKRVFESSTLKTMEYLALGIPLVLPYEDTDFKDLECDAILKIPNQEDNIQAQTARVRDFVFGMRGRRIERRLIAARIDLVSKEKMRLDFFEQCVRNCA